MDGYPGTDVSLTIAFPADVASFAVLCELCVRNPLEKERYVERKARKVPQSSQGTAKLAKRFLHRIGSLVLMAPGTEV